MIWTTVMTAEVLRILSQQGQTAVSQIQANTPKATGKTARSVRYEVKEENGKIIFRIVASKYFKALETGIKPYPKYTSASKSFVDSIKEWLSAKGSDQGAAYAIALSIHQKGTKLWQQGGNHNVFSNVITESFIDILSQDLLTQFAKEYLDSVIKTFDDNGN